VGLRAFVVFAAIVLAGTWSLWIGRLVGGGSSVLWIASRVAPAIVVCAILVRHGVAATCRSTGVIRGAGAGIESVCGLAAFAATLPIIMAGRVITISLVGGMHAEPYATFNVWADWPSALIEAPIAEELFMRGFLYGSVRAAMGRCAAVVYTSAAYALLHTNVTWWANHLLVGVVLAVVREWRVSLIACVVLHVCLNAATIACA
jgi:membrane protease YdiL (CAAX protease family)